MPAADGAAGNSAVVEASMPSEQVQTMLFPLGPVAVEATEVVASDSFARRVMRFFGVGDRVPHQPPVEISARHSDGVDVPEQVSVTQINDHDREHMQKFPAQRKAQILESIMSSRPTQNMVYHGRNRFEKAMMNMHREGYGLIDIQPQENAFTSVWYRQNRALIGRTHEVTLLLWEDSEDGETTTLMYWMI
jgi:hypothetical protein